MRLKDKHDRGLKTHTHTSAQGGCHEFKGSLHLSQRGRVMGGSEKSPHCHTEWEGGRRMEKRVRRVKQGLVGKNQTQSN